MRSTPLLSAVSLLFALTLVLACAWSCSDDKAPEASRPGLATDAATDAESADDTDTDTDTDTDADEAALVTGEAAIDLVDPFVGTGGMGYGYAALTPAAQRPYGMARVGPDTSIGPNAPEFIHFSGYHADDTDLRGFSHMHFVGTGVADYGNLRVLPHRELPAAADSARWHTPFDKASEAASPGYYAVELPEVGARVELSAGVHSGVQRYTFEKDPGAAATPALLTIDASASVTGDGVVASRVDVSPSKITGWVTYGGRYTGRTRPFTLHFSTTIEPPADAAWVWEGEAFDETSRQAEGAQVGAVLRFDAPGQPVVLRTGLSIVDLNAAEANREAQLDGRSFEEVHESARQAWAEKLGRVRLRGADDAVARSVYTALYGVYRMPTRFDGVDGRYRGLDGEVHRADGFAYYSDLSLWDTFRTLHPWLTLADPDAQRDVLLSLAAMQADGGAFPRWPAAISYTGGMLGSWADVLFAEAALKGIDGVDYAGAYESLRDTATTAPPEGAAYRGREGVAEYVELGYVPIEHGSHSASRTLEYAWGDFGMANLAAHLGRDDDEALFRERASSYRNLFHEESGFFRARYADGSFDLVDPPETIYMGGGPFTEGNAWHWRFYALHDPDGLVALFGGEAPLAAALEAFFANSNLRREGKVSTLLPDVHYWHGNEPALHAALLFHAAGRPDRLSHWVRQIQTRLYGLRPDGLPGNDDGGTLSAWYLFNALGLYPVAGSDRYLTSIPLVPYAEIDTATGTLIVEAPGAAARPQHVESVTLDGRAISGGELRHAELQDARLRFTLTEP